MKTTHSALSLRCVAAPFVGRTTPEGGARQPCRLLLLSFVSVWLAWSQIQAPSQQRTFSDEFQHGRSFPELKGGYLVSLTRTATVNSPSAIRVTSLSDGSARVISFRPPKEARTASITDATVVRGGTGMVLVGSTFSSAGMLTGFTAETDNLGNILHIEYTSSFLPGKVCAAAGGDSVWVLGSQFMGDSRPAGDLLRNYTISGKLVRSYLPRQALRKGVLTILPFGTTFGSSVTNAYLRCGQESVGAYIGRPFNSWVEINLRSEVLDQVSVTPVADALLTGLALFGSGQIHGSYLFKDGSRQLFRLTVASTRGSAQWVPESRKEDEISNILGTDGDALVHLKGSQPASSKPELNWSFTNPQR